MMFTPTECQEDQISFMDPYYPSVLSPYSCFEIDGYYNNISNGNYCHDESVLMGFSGGGNTIAESSNNYSNNYNEPILSSSSKMDATYLGDIINGIVEQDHNNDDDDNNNNNNGSTRKVQISCKKRGSKGDRHSKIPTAKGLRDRRMRLSLDVARQFFSLQDMLSYDKPSQTVKWLLLQAKSTIEELKEGNQIHNDSVKSASPHSGLGEEVVEDFIAHEKITIVSKTAPKGKEKAKHKAKKNSSNHKAKELRKRARERAKERTQMKKASVVSLNYKIEQQIEANPEDNGVVNANWSQPIILNYQEDQTYQMESIPELQFHGGSWNPYSYAQF